MDFRDLPPSIEYKEEEGRRLPKLHDGQYPPNARSDNARLRFQLCVFTAEKMFPEEPTQVWHTARSLFNNPRVTI